MRCFPGRRLFELALDLVSPPKCAACDAPVSGTSVFCPPCAASVEGWTEQAGGTCIAGVPAMAAFHYGGAFRTAIRRLKYEDRPDLARPLAHVSFRRICQRWSDALPGAQPELLAVPLHATRLATRGFNQSALLARHLAELLGARFCGGGLVRVRDTTPLAGQSRRQRQREVFGGFNASPSLRGRQLVLVDDVLTTGATVNACAEAIRAKGGEVVAALVIARAGV